MSEIIYVTEFKNEFDVWQVLHATRSKEKAYNDAGRTGRVIACIPVDVLNKISATHQEELTKLLKEAGDK